MSDQKKHHYVPEFYLKGFCRDGKLWVYDRERDVYDHADPENAACITSDDPFLLTSPRDYDPKNSPHGVGITTPGAYKGIGIVLQSSPATGLASRAVLRAGEALRVQLAGV